MSPSDAVAPDAPRRSQTLELSESRLSELEPWAVEGTGVAAAVRARDSDGRVALVKNRWSDGWMLPGGGVEPGEEPVEAARREFREEVGLPVTVDGPLVVLDQRYTAEMDGECRFSATYVVYEGDATGVIPDVADLGTAADEIRDARWFENLPEQLQDGELLREWL